MAVQLKTCGVAAVLAVALLSGCASDDKATGAEQSPESSGFTWVGQGEPTNFATDHNFCSRTTGVASNRAANFGSGADAGLDPYATSRRTSARGDYATKRQFWQCMESRGWQLVGGAR